MTQTALQSAGVSDAPVNGNEASSFRHPQPLARDDFTNLVVLLRHARAGCWTFALYNHVAVREKVVAALQALLDPLPVYHWTYSPHDPFPTSYLEQIPQAARDQRAVVFLFDFERAGEEIWKTLDYNREQFSAHPHGLVFWVTPAGRRRATREAPHFWAQRSGVFDFTTDSPIQFEQLRSLVEPNLRTDSRTETERQLRLYQGLLEEAERRPGMPPLFTAELHLKVARLADHLAQYSLAQHHSEIALALYEGIGDRAGQGTTLNNIGQIYQAQGEYGQALGYLERSLAIFEAIGDRAGQGAMLNNISQIYDAQGEYGEALGYLERSLAISEAIGDRAGLCRTRFNMGHLYWQDGQIEQALAAWVAAYVIAKQINLAQALQALAALAPQVGLPEGLAGWEQLTQQRQ